MSTNNEFQFTIVESSLGQVLVATSARGLCAVFLGDDAESLERDLRARFPYVSLQYGGKDADAVAEKVAALLDAPESDLDVTLDLRGTDFQQSVWSALRGIPAGQTATYAEIANRIGSPKSVRAVAQACGANPVSVVVPCHRVIGSDGSLSGYRWGVERKRALLEREAKVFALK